MRIIASIVTLICCCLMFVVKRETKAALLVMGAMTLTLVDIPGIPLHKANFLLQAAFILSEWKLWPQHFRKLQRTPCLWILLLIVSVSALLAALTSPYTGIAETVKTELLFKYFALAYAFMAVKNERSLKPALRMSVYGLVALTFFGILNYIDRSADLVNEMTKGEANWIYDVEFGNVYSERARFRVQSMFKSPFDYGYICAAILILHLHAWYKQMEGKKSFLVAVICCTFGIITCECRIVWVGALLSVICYHIWSFRLGRNMKIGIVGVVAMILSYNFIPAVEEKVNTLTDVFVEDSESGGSSIAMRTVQFAMTLYYVDGNELFGKGKGFFSSEIWNPDVDKRQREETGLQGLESVIFNYILERGYFGLTLWGAFYLILFLYFRRNKHGNKMLTGVGVSLLTLYLVFSIGTGELGSVYPTMLLLGMTMKMIESHKRKTMLFALLLRIMKRKNLTRRQQLAVILKAISR